MTGRWFTNSHDPKSDTRDWMRFSVGSVVVTGPPRATRTADVAELTRLKMHGLYETKSGMPALPRAEACPGHKP